MGSGPKSIVKPSMQTPNQSRRKRKVTLDMRDEAVDAISPQIKRAKIGTDDSPSILKNVEAVVRPLSPLKGYKPGAPVQRTARDASSNRVRPVDQPASSTPSSPRKPLRGGGRGRGRGGRFPTGGGRGGRKARESGDRDDSEPPSKNHLTNEERETIATLKARQHELKKFYQTVGAQQTDVLDLLAGRDLAKLVKKAKAHKKVPEYDEVTENLQERVREMSDLFQKKYETDVEHANKQLTTEKELLYKSFKVCDYFSCHKCLLTTPQERVEMAQKEHLQGAEGDLMLLEQALHAAHDDTRTEVGLESQYFPKYHTMPGLVPVRGYNSTRVIDEKPFQHQLATYNDQVRREVIDDDIIAPMAKALQVKNAQSKEEQTRKKTMNMDALTEEAGRQLKEIEARAIPRPVPMSEQNSYSLSALADISEWASKQQVRPPILEYVPSPRGVQFPMNAPTFAPQPGVQRRRPPPPPPPPQPPAPPHPAPIQQQFIFQPPQQFSGHPPQSVPPPTPQAIPVTFVNSVVSTKKSGKGAGQRILLPKM